MLCITLTWKFSPKTTLGGDAKYDATLLYYSSVHSLVHAIGKEKPGERKEFITRSIQLLHRCPMQENSIAKDVFINVYRHHKTKGQWLWPLSFNVPLKELLFFATSTCSWYILKDKYLGQCTN